MVIGERVKLNEVLCATAATLDIPDYLYEDATVKYQDIGSWLAADDSALKRYSPEVYPQGSFRLGTVVRPFSDDEYDIDLVCRLEIAKEQTTQQNLKQIVGERLKERDDLARILKPKRRCWRLVYPGTSGTPHFHMDVLPAIPNHEHLPEGILITDRELFRWQESNPNDYANWFIGQTAVILQRERAALAESIQANVDEVPDWQIKTPLQRAVQILKRHRDVYFRTDPERKPVSVIITTLAAFAYDNEESIYDALAHIIRDLPAGIERRNGQWWVANPVDPDENFADKWNEDPRRREAFERWLQQVQEDFARASQARTSDEAIAILEAALQSGVGTSVKSAAQLIPASVPKAPTQQDIPVPGLADTRHCLPPMWPVQSRYKAQVRGSVHNYWYRRLWPLTNRTVSKDLRLKFVVRTNTPQPYEVRWQVVNTGEEARHANALRGDFYESDETDPNVRWESTLYTGTHWIEAFVLKGGVCVARSGRVMVRIRPVS